MSPPSYPCSPSALDLDLWPPIVYSLLAQESRKQGVPALVMPYFRMLVTVFNSTSFIIEELYRAGRDQSTSTHGWLVRYVNAERKFDVPVLMVSLSAVEVGNPRERMNATSAALSGMRHIVDVYGMEELAAAFPFVVISAIGYDACVFVTTDGTMSGTCPRRPGKADEEIPLDWYRLNVMSPEGRAILEAMSRMISRRLRQSGCVFAANDPVLASTHDIQPFLPKYTGSGRTAPQRIEFPIFDGDQDKKRTMGW